jgi:hypothetical protein
MPDVTGGVSAIGGIGSMIGGLFGGSGDNGSDTALQAAQLQYQGSQNAIAAQQQAVAEARGYMQPYYKAGTSALDLYGGLLNVPGFAPQDPTATLRATPGYDWQMGQGVNALERGAAARGGLYSGAQMKGLTKYGQGMADQTYQNYLNRIGGMATSGQNAAALQGGYGMTAAPNIGNYMTYGGNALAQGQIGAYNANQSAYQNQMGNVLGGLGALGYGAGKLYPQVSNWFNQGNVGTQGQSNYGGNTISQDYWDMYMGGNSPYQAPS